MLKNNYKGFSKDKAGLHVHRVGTMSRQLHLAQGPAEYPVGLFYQAFHI